MQSFVYAMEKRCPQFFVGKDHGVVVLGWGCRLLESTFLVRDRRLVLSTTAGDEGMHETVHPRVVLEELTGSVEFLNR